MNEHTSRAKKPEIVENGQKIYGVSSWAWVIFTILMLTLGIRAWVKVPSTPKPPQPPTAMAPASASAMQKMPVTETVTVSPGIEFVLPTKDWEWVSFDPKGGCVHITRPDGIKYTDCEGMNTHMPPLRVRGEYVITAVDKEVRVVIVLW